MPSRGADGLFWEVQNTRQASQLNIAYSYRGLPARVAPRYRRGPSEVTEIRIAESIWHIESAIQIFERPPPNSERTVLFDLFPGVAAIPSSLDYDRVNV
jgi:hypothetical protein